MMMIFVRLQPDTNAMKYQRLPYRDRCHFYSASRRTMRTIYFYQVNWKVVIDLIYEFFYSISNTACFEQIKIKESLRKLHRTIQWKTLVIMTGIEPAFFGTEVQRLIHWTTRSYKYTCFSELK